jgi:hypothetical protein
MFKLWPNGKPFPKFEYIVQSYDVATSEKVQNDPTASHYVRGVQAAGRSDGRDGDRLLAGAAAVP